MSRRTSIIAFAATTVLLAGLLLIYIQRLNPWQAHIRATEAHLQAREAQAQQWLKQDSLWLRISQAPYRSPGGERLPKGFSFVLYEGQEAVFWTGQKLNFPSPPHPPQVQPALKYPPHYYIHQPLPGHRSLSVAFQLPDAPRLSRQPTAYPIHNQAGEVVAYLESVKAIALPPFWQKAQFASALLFTLCLLLLLDLGARRMAKPRPRFWPFLIAVAIAGGWLYQIGQSQHPAIPYLQQLQSTDLGYGSLLQFMGLALACFWLLSLAQRLPLELPAGHWPQLWLLLLGLLGFLSIAAGLLLGGAIFKVLLLETTLEFDFSNVLMLGAAELSALSAVVLLMLSFLLYSLWVVKGIHRLPLPRNHRLLTLGVAILPAIPLALSLDLGLGLLPVVLLPLLYIALLDLFVELEAASPAWLMLWLALLSAFAAGLLFKYNLDKGRAKRLAFAHRLAAPGHQSSLNALTRFQEALPDTLHPDSLGNLMLHHPYLYKNFHWKILPARLGQQLLPPKASQPPYVLQPNQKYYTYGLPWQGDSLLAFQPVLQPDRRVLRQLVPDAPHQNEAYAISLFQDTVLIAQRGYFLRAWLSTRHWPEPGSSQEWLSSQRANLYYSAPEGYTVVIGEELGGYVKPLSLFSYLFALLTVFALLVFAANRYYTFLPATPGELLFGPPSLRHRVQLSVIGLTLFGFIFIGAVTVASLQQSSVAYHGERLLEKIDVLLRDLQTDNFRLDDQSALRKLSEIHQVDLNVYNAQGQLANTAMPFFFSEGWQSRRINPEALVAFNRQGFKPALLREQAGPLGYLSAYAPIARPEGGVGYFLQIPFTSGARSLQENVLAFIGNLLNLYVFLLLIAGALAITVANSITRPLMKIGEKLRSFQLGRNEPLEWDSEDEIGRLVEAYNDMIQKLEESAEKLRQSEREGAWREMAKQVAHEIKNPLTPMKLSIQYLEHARRSDPEQATAMIGSVAQTLIEQIDGLARIATEFSNFAKMPKAQPEALDLRAVLKSVYRLFTEHQEPTERIELLLPEGAAPAFADRGHLVRVLNNLIKNAQQAIPDDGQGHIQVQLTSGPEEHLITVADNGTGIPEAVQAKVFQPNFTTKSSGMGLGLAMCKNMMTAAGGDIYFETKAGAGTTFFVKLPASKGTQSS